MADALLQLTQEISTGSESSDTASDAEANTVDINVSSKPLTSLPPMMLNESEADVSTEEEDNVTASSPVSGVDPDLYFCNGKLSYDIHVLSVSSLQSVN